MKHLGMATQGMMAVQDGLLLPEQLNIVTEKSSPGWRAVLGDGSFAFDRKLREAGWECFFLAGELKAMSFGSSRAGMLNGAVRRLLAKVRSQDFNCAEFTRIKTSHFLGIPYVTVRGHARHIQQGCQLDTTEKRRRQQTEGNWACNS